MNTLTAEVDEANPLGIKRDHESLDKEKKKKKPPSLLNVVNKMNQLINIENKKKFTDSDEEILEEVEQFKELLGKQIEDDMKLKKEEFKKIALKNLDVNTNDKNQNPLANKTVGGLILPNKNAAVAVEQPVNQEKNYFEEIINNISQDDFNIEKYSEINKVLTRKNEDKWNKRKALEEVDYSTGGLQTFEKKPNKEYGLILNPSRNTEEEYFETEENPENIYGEDQNYLNKKRQRMEASYNKYLDISNTKHKVYGATQKPKSRNIEQEEFDENDYEANYMPSDKYKIEHDISSSNPYKREKDYDD